MHSLSRSGILCGLLLAGAAASACVPQQAAPGGIQDDEPAVVAQTQQALSGEDSLVDAYANFKSLFTLFGQDQTYRIGAGYHPGLSTEKLTVNNFPAAAKVVFDFASKHVTAQLLNAPASEKFDLYLVKNSASGTVAPEAGDQNVFVGSFSPLGDNGRTLDVDLGDKVRFDLDMVVVTRGGKKPKDSRVLVGARTLFEKRFFREVTLGSAQAALNSLQQAVKSPVSNAVETTDPLVTRGAQLFFNETFGGNGRTCGTCHRAEHNLTIDADFIKTLPANDPLFVAESNPALNGLENPQLMRGRGLILENVDGLDDPKNKFVMRSVNHTFTMSTTLGIDQALAPFPVSPADQRLGWGGDGSPGRGTLNEFAFGAVVQHFTKSFVRKPGTDFRIPTQEELDALEAFQLFSGRQKFMDSNQLVLADAPAEAGRQLFLGNAKCTNCHFDMAGNSANLNVNTNVVARMQDLPVDDGFKAPFNAQAGLGDGQFNIPTLVEAADTAPLFHNNSAASVEDAIGHYLSDNFRATPIGAALNIQLNDTEKANLAAFLREINAAENVRQVTKRAQFVHDHRSTGNTSILDVAINDAQDALNDLSAKNLNSNARHDIATARLALVIARSQADQDRPAYLETALTYLGRARSDLVVSDGNGLF